MKQEHALPAANPARRALLLAGGLSLLPSTRLAFAQTPAAAAAGARKTISVDGRRARVVDIHTHCYIPGSARMMGSAEMAAAANPAEGSATARSLTINDARVAQMDARGIDHGVLSVNQYWWYAAPVADAEKFVRFQDEGLAAICARYPGRFSFLSSPALQHPVLAAQQLEHAVKNLGARGASVGGHVNGRVPSGSAFDVFWAKAQELDVPVFMHPGGAENIIKPSGLDGPGDLSNVIGNPLETTLFASRMIFEGALDRAPKLKLILAHGGGYIASYLGRTDVACEFRAAAKCVNKRRPAEYFRDQLYVDSMVFSHEGLRHLVATCGYDHVVYGSDMPYNWPDTADIIATSSDLPPEQRLAILGGNLARMLRLPAGS